EIRRIQRETGITTIFVTHDQEEAMSISDAIVVMKDGVVQQIGAPQEVYNDPCNLFVAKFLGTPPINVFSGTVRGEKLYLGEDCVLDVPGIADRDVTVGIRPEGFEVDADGPMCCSLSAIEVMGRDVSVVAGHASCQSASIRAIVDADEVAGISAQSIRFRLKPHKVDLFDPVTEVRIPV
ncbi:MAG: ABC transporter ATP-binding protein, partial [Clostridia bacterium]|nr:ABC transporter ATP-binding protein [Clostridia bacterium]